MLSMPLADQQALNEFIKDKTDREIGVVALTIIDQHVRECSERWNHIMLVLKWIGSALGLLVLERLANDVPTIKPLLAHFFGG